MPAAFVFCSYSDSPRFFSAGLLFFPDTEDWEESGCTASEHVEVCLQNVEIYRTNLIEYLLVIC